MPDNAMQAKVMSNIASVLTITIATQQEPDVSILDSLTAFWTTKYFVSRMIAFLSQNVKNRTLRALETQGIILCVCVCVEQLLPAKWHQLLCCTLTDRESL